MAKLYVFSIGGTGSRVLKSLSMLLATGGQHKSDFDTIVPIILDPDSSNGDLQRSLDILRKYQTIQEYGNEFFGIKIKTLNQLADSENNMISESFRFQFAKDADGSFKNYIGLNQLDESNKALIKLLFSQQTLDSNMDVGFRGNPNMGSIVLNQFAESREFKTFYSTFNKGDAIFIISSIFGGTGAAGFPLLIKNLRNKEAGFANTPEVSNAPIGAVSMLPYFKINPEEESQINSSTFMQKTTAALSYYSNSVTAKNGVDLFYYLGDQEGNANYENHEGGYSQKNKAHFLEMAAALSITDFMQNKPAFDPGSEPLVKEFGIKNNKRNINLNDLGNHTQREVASGLVRFWLMKKYLDEGFVRWKDKNQKWHTRTKNVQWQKPKKTGIKYRALNHQFRDDLAAFLDYYEQWLKELQSNDVSFSPFYLNKDFSNALELFEPSTNEEKKHRRSKSLKKLDNYNVRVYPRMKAEPDLNTRLIRLFEESTKELYDHYFKNL